MRDGKIEKTKDGVPYEFRAAKKTQVYQILPNKELSTRTTLDKLIKDTGATELVKHGTFVAGKAPASFTPSPGYGLAVANASHMDALRIAAGMGSVELVWVLKRNDKVLGPYAVAMVTTKQLIIPARPRSVQLM